METREQNFTIGRGMVYVDDRYIGETNSFRFLGNSKLGLINFAFECEDISSENIKLYFDVQCKERPKSKVRYVANNPAGKNVNFNMDGVTIRAGSFELKSGNGWQNIGFYCEAEGIQAVLVPDEKKG